jgi:hypothetical protein
MTTDKGRFRKIGTHDDSQDLGPLSMLPGKWRGKGTGWNMIALPFKDGPSKFRVLMNQFDEELEFSVVDDDVPNRGLPGIIDNSTDFDQFVVTLDYKQVIHQVAAEDFPPSGLAGNPGIAIHHEPGLWLYMKNLQTPHHDVGTTNGKIEVGRLASIPHGNAVLALGTQESTDGPPTIPPVRGIVFGRFDPVGVDPYLDPYKHYLDNPFKGKLSGVPGFPGFSPADMNEILRFANQGVNIAHTTTLTVDTQRENAGITNIPFIVKQAEATSMRATFWIEQMADHHHPGRPKLRMQYSQTVMLDFFQPRKDQMPGRAQWPHISINTLEKIHD